LLESGADPSIRNKEGKTALDIARQWVHEDIVAIIEEHSK
jgi:ankyrin repeat protein